MLYRWKTVKNTNTNPQIHNINTAYDEVSEIPNICYISKKLVVQRMSKMTFPSVPSDPIRDLKVRLLTSNFCIIPKVYFKQTIWLLLLLLLLGVGGGEAVPPTHSITTNFRGTECNHFEETLKLFMGICHDIDTVVNKNYLCQWKPVLKANHIRTLLWCDYASQCYRLKFIEHSWQSKLQLLKLAKSTCLVLYNIYNL